MKKILATLLCFCCGSALAQTAQELIDNGKNSENVTTFGMGYHLNQYSPLSQINKSNIKRLVPVWSTSLSNDTGELAQPTIYNGVMYVVNGHWTFALDVATGQQIWRTPVEYDRGAARVGAAGVILRGGATIYNGKLFRETIDCHVIALDMKTGKQIWKQKFADFKEGYTGIIAPLVANGVVITGMAGGDRTTRGFLDGWDPDTGKELWRRYTIPAPGEPGSETWPKDIPDAWKYGGGATWQNGSYDPELDLVYWGTGNAEPYNPAYRGGADSLYTASVIAIRPKTGELVWHYQYIPNESFDFDGTAEPVLADLRIDGQVRKVLLSANKNGFMYVIDRTNGKLIAAHPFVKVNWASRIDPRDRPPGSDRRLRPRAQRRDGRSLAVARHQRVADGVQSEDRPRLRELLGNPPDHEIHQVRIRARRRLHRRRDELPHAAGGRAVGLSHGVQSGHRQSGMESAGDGNGDLRRHARNRRRGLVHRPAERRVHRARPGDRGDAVEVQDRIRHQFSAHDLHPQRPAIRHGAVGHRRRSQPRHESCRRGPHRRIGVDLRADARIRRR